MISSVNFEQVSLMEEGISVASSLLLCSADQFVSRGWHIRGLCIVSILFFISWGDLIFQNLCSPASKCQFVLQNFSLSSSPTPKAKVSSDLQARLWGRERSAMSQL